MKIGKWENLESKNDRGVVIKNGSLFTMVFKNGERKTYDIRPEGIVCIERPNSEAEIL